MFKIHRAKQGQLKLFLVLAGLSFSKLPSQPPPLASLPSPPLPSSRLTCLEQGLTPPSTQSPGPCSFSPARSSATSRRPYRCWIVCSELYTCTPVHLFTCTPVHLLLQEELDSECGEGEPHLDLKLPLLRATVLEVIGGIHHLPVVLLVFLMSSLFVIYMAQISDGGRYLQTFQTFLMFSTLVEPEWSLCRGELAVPSHKRPRES